MPGKNRDAVKQALGGRVGLGQLKDDRTRIRPSHGDRLPTDHQRITLRRMDVLIKIYGKTKNDVIDSEWLSVRETQASAKFYGVSEAVRGDLPGLSQRGFDVLRETVDMDEIRGHLCNNFSRRNINRRDRV